MKKIKVAFYIYDMNVGGGIATVFASTIDALKDFPEFDISVFTQSGCIDDFYMQFFKERPWIHLDSVYPLAKKFENNSKNFFVKTAYKIYKKYRSFKMKYMRVFDKYDMVIDYRGASTSVFRNLKKCKFTWVHESFNHINSNNGASRLKYYDKIICISDSFKQDMEKLYPEYKDKLVRIYNPIDYKEISKICKNTPKYDGKYFCCVGRVSSDKDTATIISAFDDFFRKENKPDVKMVFIGSGNTFDDMQKMAQKTSARDNIIFLGKIPQPYGYMHGAMAHILSSYNEGLPTVLIEAMACATLNISSNCPNGPHEVLLDGKAGLLFEPGNVKELSKMMSDVYHKSIDIDSMKNSANKSLIRFNRNKIAKQISDLIKQSI
jgi:glycosyltransferase involved in cell wall biosynthesis